MVWIFWGFLASLVELISDDEYQDLIDHHTREEEP